MQVKIDTREKDRIQSASSYYRSQKLDVTVEELPVGDFIFNDKVCFEFKTVADYVSSIQDHRVFNQAIEMAENFDYAFVIIQGDEHERAKAISMSKHYQEISYFQYLGSIASLNRYVTVIESYSPYIEEAYYRMMAQAQKCLQNKPIVKKFPKKHKNPAYNYLAYCIYGVSAKRASEIVYTCHLKTMEDLFNLTHQDLVKIEGIGDNLADRILQSISEDSYES